MADWDGEFTVLVRKRVSRHVDSCANCNEARGRLVSPLSLLGAAPLLIPAPSWLRESTLIQMQHAPLGAGVAGAATHVAGHGIGRFAAWVVALFAVPVATVGVAVSLTAPHDSPGTSVQFSSPVPTTSVTASSTNVAPPQPSTSTPPPVGPAAPGPSAGNRGVQPTAQVPSAAPSATVVQQAPPAPSRTQAAPAPSAPASTAAPRSREPKKPPVMETPKPTTDHHHDHPGAAAAVPAHRRRQWPGVRQADALISWRRWEAVGGSCPADRLPVRSATARWRRSGTGRTGRHWR